MAVRNNGSSKMKVKVYKLNSFAKEKTGGNPAGVVIDADLLSEASMQRVAQQVGFSETAFVQKSDKADFKVRFFTPAAEVDLCGHATIAAFNMMFRLGYIKSGTYTQETKAGILHLDVGSEGNIFMEQLLPTYFEQIDKNEIAECLNIQKNDFIEELPVQVVSTGIKDIFVPIRNLKTLLNIQPNMQKIVDLSKKYDVVGMHIFSLQTKNDSTAHCRNFAPLYGIPEESATGTSNGALSCYLYKYGIVSEEQLSRLVFEQGYSMERPSEILAALEVGNNKEVEGQIINKSITRVKVGGNAELIDEINIEID